MQLPKTLAGPIAKSSKGKSLEVVKISANHAEDGLQEIGVTEAGNAVECFVVVSVGERLSLNFSIPCGEQQIIDLYVDGILRETSHNKGNKLHHGTFSKVLHCEKRASGAKGKAQHYDMVVENRVATHDLYLTTSTGTSSPPVSTIEIRILRKLPSGKLHGAKFEKAVREPTFETHLSWWEINKSFEVGVVAPCFQIGLNNPADPTGSARKNIKSDVSGYYLWASFKFKYRSASELRALGFDLMENPSGTSFEPKIDNFVNSDSTVGSNTAIKVENALDSTNTSAIDSTIDNAIDGMMSNTIDSTVDSVMDTTMGSLPSVMDDARKEDGTTSEEASTAVLADKVKEDTHHDSEITSAIQNYKDDKLKRDSSDQGGNTFLPAGGKQVFGDSFPIPTDEEFYRNRNASEGYGGSLQSAGNGQARYRNVQGQDETPRIGLPGLARKLASQKADGTLVDQVMCARVKQAEVSPKSLPGIGISPSHFREEPEGGRDMLDMKNSKFSAPGIQPAKVDANESLARFTYDEPSQKSPVTLIKKSIETDSDIREDQPIKRKFEDFYKDGLCPFLSPFKRDVSVMSRTERSMSPRLRREEHARKRQAKIESLEKVKAEAEALRRQVTEYEATEAKEKAEEDAELDELDREIERQKQDAEASKAWLRELQELQQ